MELLRRHIETQVHGLTGLALGGIDFEQPPGDPGLFGPDSVCWRVHGDFTSMLVGGICALLLQMLHPSALAGVWDHSNFRQDMLGRLRRTGQFISGTTYASTADADRLIARVRDIHDRVSGALPDGTPYSANDPDLLTWVHVAEVSSFLRAHIRYRNPALSKAEQDRYFREVALIARRLGATAVPQSCEEVEHYLHTMRPALHCDARTREVANILLTNPPSPSIVARPFGVLFIRAGVDLLPAWAAGMLGLSMNRLSSQAVQKSVHGIAPVLRWAVRNGSAQRARRRMEI